LNGLQEADVILVMDDYVHCFMSYLIHLPVVTLSSPLFQLATAHTLSALTCPAPETSLICLDTLALLSQRLSHAETHPRLQPIFQQYGKAILSLTLAGVFQGFPEDGLDQVQRVVAATVSCAPPAEVEGWVSEALNEIPGHVVPSGEKQTFLRELHECVFCAISSMTV